jgi:DNA-binding transcriptional LysR family regulator
MAELRGSLSGTIRAGLIPSLTKGALAGVLNSFIAEHPYVDFHIVEAYSQPLTDQVIAGELDFAIVPVMPESDVPGLHRRVLAREQELLLSGPALGLASMAPFPLAGLAGLRLVLPSRANSRRPYLDSQLARAGVAPARIMDIDGMTGTLEFVAGSDWATILPVTNCLGELARGRLRLNPIVDPGIAFEFILIEATRRPLSAAARLFVAAIEARLAEIGDEWRRVLQRHRRRRPPPAGSAGISRA